MYEFLIVANRFTETPGGWSGSRQVVSFTVEASNSTVALDHAEDILNLQYGGSISTVNKVTGDVNSRMIRRPL